MSFRLMTFQEFRRRTEGSTAGPRESMHSYMTHFMNLTQVAASTTPEGVIEVLEMIERVAESEHLPTNFSEYIRDTPSISDSRLYAQVLSYRLHVLQHVSRVNQRRAEQVHRPTYEERRAGRAEPTLGNVSPAGTRGYWVRARAPRRQASAMGWVRERAPRSASGNNGHHNRRDSYERREHRQRHDPYERREHRQRHDPYERSDFDHLQYQSGPDGGYYVEERAPQSAGRDDVHHHHSDRGAHQRNDFDHLQFQSGLDGDYYVEERAPQNGRQHGHPGYFPSGLGHDAALNAAIAESLRDFERDYERVSYSDEDGEEEMVEYEPVSATSPDFYSQYENGLNPFGEPLPQRPVDTTTYEAPASRMPTATESSEKCSICLNPPRANETVTVLPCIGHAGHWFHHECIANWIRMKRVQDCPLRCAQRPAS